MPTLRPYQDRFVRYFLTRMLLPDPEQEYLLSSPTGSGKTLVTQALVGHVLATEAFTHCLIITPQVQIEQGFLFGRGPKGGKVNDPAKHTKRIQTYKGQLDLRPHEWDAARHSTSGIRSFLARRPQGKQTKVMVTTHAAATRRNQEKEDFLPDDLTRVLLVVDEGHRAGEANKLGQGFLQDWKSRGGAIFYLTATPFRTDGKSVIPDDICRQTRTIAEHADGVYAPGDLQVLALPISMLATNQAEYSGEKLPQRGHAESADEIVALWEKDGKPKSVIVVPSTGSKNWAKLLQVKLEAAGGKVFNAVGKIPTDKTLTALLKREREVTQYEDSQVDVIIACKRFDEGTDWPLCSHVYNIKIPGAFNLILQRWGRAMRSKQDIQGYPDQHVNIARMTFLIPRITEETWTRFAQHHKDHVFLLACFLQDFETAGEYKTCLRWRPEDIGRRRSGTSQPSEAELLEDLQAELMASGADHIRADAIRTIIQLEQALRDKDTEPTIKNALELAVTLKLPDDEVQAVRDLWGFRLLLREEGEQVMETLVRRLTRQSNGAPLPRSIIRAGLREAFDEVIAAHETEVIRSELDGAEKYIGELTGLTAATITRELRERLPVPDHTLEEILAAALRHHESTS